MPETPTSKYLIDAFVKNYPNDNSTSDLMNDLRLFQTQTQSYLTNQAKSSFNSTSWDSSFIKELIPSHIIASSQPSFVVDSNLTFPNELHNMAKITNQPATSVANSSVTQQQTANNPNQPDEKKKTMGFQTAADMLYGPNGHHKNKSHSTNQQNNNSSDSKLRSNNAGGGKNNDEDDGESNVLAELGLEDSNLEVKHVEAVLRMVLKQAPGSEVTEKDIAGLESTKMLIRECIIEPILRPDLHRGLLAAPQGVLLFGPPGCGKTTIAKWIATESGATFLEVSPSSLTSKFYGESEKMVRALWKVAAKLAPAVIFIDEIDCLIGLRTEKEEDSTIRMKNELLQMMDGVGSDPSKMIVVVGATNRPNQIDEAARRRLSKRVLIPLPDPEARREQIRHLLTKHGQELSYEDFEQAAALTEGFNGSDIKEICRQAAMKGHRELIAQYGGIKNIPIDVPRRLVRFEDVQSVASRVKPSVGKDSLGDYERFQQEFGCE